jgi:hypothetical protein
MQILSKVQIIGYTDIFRTDMANSQHRLQRLNFENWSNKRSPYSAVFSDNMKSLVDGGYTFGNRLVFHPPGKNASRFRAALFRALQDYFNFTRKDD